MYMCLCVCVCVWVIQEIARKANDDSILSVIDLYIYFTSHQEDTWE